MASIEETGRGLQGPQKVIPWYPLGCFIYKLLIQSIQATRMIFMPYRVSVQNLHSYGSMIRE